MCVDDAKIAAIRGNDIMNSRQLSALHKNNRFLFYLALFMLETHTALMIASRRGHGAVVTLLLKKDCQED